MDEKQGSEPSGVSDRSVYQFVGTQPRKMDPESWFFKCIDHWYIVLFIIALIGACVYFEFR